MQRLAWLSQFKNLDERQLWRLVLVGVISTSLLSAVIGGFSGGNLIQWFGNWLLDFSTDLAGGAVVMLFIRYSLKQLPSAQPQPEIIQPPTQTYFIDASEIPLPPTQPLQPSPQERLEHYLKALRIGSTVEARQAILNQLQKEGFSLAGQALIDIDLQGANLQGIDLTQTDLAKAKLRGVSLQRAHLRDCNFYMAQLIEADLQEADLSQANFERAFLSGADFGGAILRGAKLATSLWRVNLAGADLRGADLSNAELFRTNLQGARLEGVTLADTKINADTILPDGSTWSARADITRFTDPAHPQFWSPEASRVIHEKE